MADLFLPSCRAAQQGKGRCLDISTDPNFMSILRSAMVNLCLPYYQGQADMLCLSCYLRQLSCMHAAHALQAARFVVNNVHITEYPEV